MKDLIDETVAEIMEQHFDAEMISDLKRCKLIACEKGFEISTKVCIELELEALVKKVLDRSGMYD
jgi:hypothetical protein